MISFWELTLLKKSVALASIGTSATVGGVASHYLFNNNQKIQKLSDENKEQRESISELEEKMKVVDKEGKDNSDHWAESLLKEQREQVILEKREECFQREKKEWDEMGALYYFSHQFNHSQCEKIES